MAIVVTIGGNDLTAKIDSSSVVIEQTAQDMIATCTLRLMDDALDVDVNAMDAITVVDGATVYFKGEVAGEPERREVSDGLLEWYIECQDYNKLLNETVVTSYSVGAGTTSDADIIDAMGSF